MKSIWNRLYLRGLMAKIPISRKMEYTSILLGEGLLKKGAFETET